MNIRGRDAAVSEHDSDERVLADRERRQRLDGHAWGRCAPGDRLDLPRRIADQGIRVFALELPEHMSALFVKHASVGAAIVVNAAHTGQLFDGKGGATPAERWRVGFRVRDVDVSPDGVVGVLQDGSRTAPGGLFRLIPKHGHQ